MHIAEFICMLLILFFLVIPAFLRVQWRESRARQRMNESRAAGRHEPVTIVPWIDPGACMGSGACVRACPEDVLQVIDGQAHVVDAAACVGHGACDAACPVNAIKLVFGSATRGVDLPHVGSDFQTNMPGLYVAGELGGMGLIANAVEQGAQAMESAARGIQQLPGIHDAVIVGAGPAGLSAAVVARQLGLDHVVLEQQAMGGAIRHYPRQKLVFSRPIAFRGQPAIKAGSMLKEELVAALEALIDRTGIRINENEAVTELHADQDGYYTVSTERGSYRAQRVLLSIGRRGTPRTLGVAGEELKKVSYWLKDPQLYEHQDLLVVGAGDSAVEAACSLGDIDGNRVWLSARGKQITRPRKKNLQRLRDSVKRGRVQLMLGSKVVKITPDRVVLEQDGQRVVVPNDFVFVCIGGVLPTEFLRQAGVDIRTHHGAGPAAEPSTVPFLADMLLAEMDPADLEDRDPGTDEVPLAHEVTVVRTPSQLIEAVQSLELTDHTEYTDPLGLPPPLATMNMPLPNDDHTVWAESLSDLLADALEDSIAPGTRRKIEPDWSVPEDKDRLLEVMADLLTPLASGSGSAALARLRRIAEATRERIPGELAANAAAEAQLACDHEDLERVAALRALGLMALRRGDVNEASERFETALNKGRQNRLPAADEARTHRWIAEARSVDSRYRSAATHLWNGVRRLGPAGPTVERAALLARQVELELDLGRLTDALRAADSLLELARENAEAGWMPTALCSVGAVSLALGDRVVAVTSAVRAADALDLQESRPWRPTVATARLLCSVDLAERALPLLNGLDIQLPHNPLVDPHTQVLAVHARALTGFDQERAERLAIEAAARATALDRGRAARALLDLAIAFEGVRFVDRAYSSGQQGLRLAYPLGAHGLRLDLLETLEGIRHDERVAMSLVRVRERMAKDLSPERAERFLAGRTRPT